VRPTEAGCVDTDAQTGRLRSNLPAQLRLDAEVVRFGERDDVERFISRPEWDRFATAVEDLHGGPNGRQVDRAAFAYGERQFFVGEDPRTIGSYTSRWRTTTATALARRRPRSRAV
jgi:hypothetical protein